MRMGDLRFAWFMALVPLAAAGACVSNNGAPPGGGEDAGIEGQDAQVAFDAAVSDATVNAMPR